MQPKNFFKKATYMKFAVNSEKKLRQADLENIVSDLKFKRCKGEMLKSMGFIHPIEDYISDSGLSYVIGDWFLFAIRIEEKQVSSSEVSFELQEILNDIEKTEHRKVKGAEKAEIKEKIYKEKAKTAPSKFSAFYVAFDHKGNVLINTTSKKPLDTVSDLVLRAFSEYFTASSGDFSAELSMVATKMLKNMDATIPSGIELSLGNKGEGKNGSQKISFDKIMTDDENILSMLKGYDLEITKVELFHLFKDCPISYFMSNKGVEGMSYDEVFMDYFSEKTEDAGSEEEAIDISLDMTFQMLMEFYREYFMLLRKVVPFAKAKDGILEKTFTSGKELSEFLSEE